MRPRIALAAALAVALAAAEARAWDARCGCMELPAPRGPSGSFTFGAGLVRPAFAVRAEFDYLWERWQLGVEAEFNPYFTLERVDVAPGSFNAAVTGGLRLRITQGLTMRFEAGLGVSVLLFEAYGYAPGTPGIYASARVLGLDLDFGRRVLLGVDLVDLSFIVFQVTEMPYLYPQWRASISIRLVRPRERSRREEAPAAPQPAPTP